MTDTDLGPEDPTYRSELGRRIDAAIARFRTKGAAAAAAGISTEQLNKWIAGTVKVPVEGLRAISIGADVDLSWLATGEGEMRAEPSHEVAGRLRAIADDRRGGAAELAEMLGISPEAWAATAGARTALDAAMLGRLAGLGYSADWILTGAGRMRLDGPAGGAHEGQAAFAGPAGPAAGAPIDDELMGRCADAVARVHKDLGISFSYKELGRVAGQVYADAVAASDDPAERLVAVRAGIARLRRELLSAPPGTARTKAEA